MDEASYRLQQSPKATALYLCFFYIKSIEYPLQPTPGKHHRMKVAKLLKAVADDEQCTDTLNETTENVNVDGNSPFDDVTNKRQKTSPTKYCNTY